MAEKVNHGRSKMISSYGGVGSVIDTPDSSIIIETFDNWGYPVHYEQDIKKHIILDDRLINRLRARFPNVRHLVNIPVEEDGWRTDVEPQANYFPKWFYCPRCKKFMKLADWKKHWKNKQEFDLQCFNPKCKEEHLEQVRFVMTCNDGHIQDLPWDYWNNRLPAPDNDSSESSDSEQEKESKIILNYERKCCDEQELYYRISNENTDLSGIHIKCEKCGKSATLKGIFGFSQKCGGRKYWLGLQNGQFVGENCEQKVTVKIKSSNSVYYANTLSSLWIPEKQKTIEREHRLLIEKWLDRGKSKDKIIEDLFEDYDVPKEVVIQYLEETPETDVRDIIYRQAEYDYFTQKEQPENKAIKFRQIQLKDYLNGFEKLVKIDRLKKITVQTSFTRNEPIDTDSILINNDNEYEYCVKRQPISKNSFETRLLPAIENYGEGILFVLDEQRLIQWEKNEDIKDRIKEIQSYAEDSDWQSHKIEARNLTARKILIHTLSHLLIREFEYVCGYPMSSLQERLYVCNNMNGFLISAYDGSDGYLGGLTKLCNNLEKLQDIISSALQRAKDCSLDPICYESEGQGVAQLNLASCHSCSHIPETSCEMSNLFLDRKLVIDEKLGYFKHF